MKILILILISFNLPAQLDKTKHFLAGQIISSTAGTAYFLIKPYKPFKACLVGFVTGVGAGLFKEILDSRKGGTGFNNDDFGVTIWGAAVGTLSLRIGIHEFYGKKRTIHYNLLEN